VYADYLIIANDDDPSAAASTSRMHPPLPPPLGRSLAHVRRAYSVRLQLEFDSAFWNQQLLDLPSDADDDDHGVSGGDTLSSSGTDTGTAGTGTDSNSEQESLASCRKTRLRPAWFVALDGGSGDEDNGDDSSHPRGTGGGGQPQPHLPPLRFLNVDRINGRPILMVAVPFSPPPATGSLTSSASASSTSSSASSSSSSSDAAEFSAAAQHLWIGRIRRALAHLFFGGRVDRVPTPRAVRVSRPVAAAYWDAGATQKSSVVFDGYEFAHLVCACTCVYVCMCVCVCEQVQCSWRRSFPFCVLCSLYSRCALFQN
jgi:hypothetical protein